MTNKPKVNLHSTMDARIWAEEFCRIVGEKIPAIKDEQDWMLGWFANAIMAGYDKATPQKLVLQNGAMLEALKATDEYLDDDRDTDLHYDIVVAQIRAAIAAADPKTDPS